MAEGCPQEVEVEAAPKEEPHLHGDLPCCGSCANARLLCIAKVPPSMRINAYVRHGYRRHPNPVYRCLLQCFTLNNETFNVWSHVYAAAACGRRIWQDLYTKLDPKTRLGAHHLAFASSTALFATSATAHALASHSDAIAELLFRVDRSMIAVHICSVTCACILIGFRRHPWLRRTLLTSAIVACGASTLGANVPGMSAGAKALCFALQCALPLYVAVRELRVTNNARIRRVILGHTFWSLAWSVLGGLTFGNAAPERWLPHDSILGLLPPFNSHNIMHVCAYMSAVHCWRGLRKWSLLHRGLK